MGYRARVQSKRVIEYGDVTYCNNKSAQLLEWLLECNINVNTLYNSSTEEWEIYREGLYSIKERDYDRLPSYIKDETKNLVADLLRSNKKSDWVYLSWW